MYKKRQSGKSCPNVVPHRLIVATLTLTLALEQSCYDVDPRNQYSRGSSYIYDVVVDISEKNRCIDGSGNKKEISS